MKPKHIKKFLLLEIKQIAEAPHIYCAKTKSDFTRNRKLLLERLLLNRIMEMSIKAM